MIVTYSTDSPALTEKQKKEIQDAAKKPIIYDDDDSPKMTPQMEKAFRCAAAQRNRRKA